MQKAAAELKQKTKLEELIISSRCTGKSYGELKDEDKYAVCQSIVINGTVYHGFETITDDFMEALIKCMSMFIDNAQYEDFTEDEFLLVLQLSLFDESVFPKGIDFEKPQKNGAKHFNMPLFANLLQQYRAIRTFLDQKIINKLNGYEEGGFFNS